MPSFAYSALNEKGKKVSGTIEGDNLRVANNKLSSKGLFVTEIKEAGYQSGAQKFDVNNIDLSKLFNKSGVSSKDLTIMTRQLSTLISAGLPLVTALQTLPEQTDNQNLKKILISIKEDVEEGKSLASALTKFSNAFPRLYTNMVEAGEASGKLDLVLSNLAEYLESQLELRRKIKSALTYPILMLTVCTLVIVALFVFVVPNIIDIFTKQGAILPLPTRIMLVISNFITGYWYIVLIMFFGSIATFSWYYKQELGRAKVDSLLFKLPIFGKVYQKVITARVSINLSTLLNSGVDLLKSLEITKRLIGNVHVVKALDTARDRVREGASLSNEIANSKLFPTLLPHMIAIGEKSGQLEQMLTKAGESYEAEVNASLDGLTSLLEPLMMIVVGGVVLVIVISILLPMTDLINVIG